MSTSRAFPADGEQPSSVVNLSDSEDPPATPDPLLGSGSFIDPNNGGQHSASKEPDNSKESDPLLQKYGRPSWLPEGWDMILRKRTSGATEGTVDRVASSINKDGTSREERLLEKDHMLSLTQHLLLIYAMILRKCTVGEDGDDLCCRLEFRILCACVTRYYIAPSGQRLRSKNEVLTFLETGSKRKKPATPSSDDATSKGTMPQTKKKTSARKKVHAAFTFDFKNPPEKVSWCLSYATEDVWSPSVGDWNVPLSTKQEWAAVFNHVCQN
ncbi:hypothetical protein E3N88_26830 [Mikania micrantha]|uniref:MBD domain-containing protein n=1 Tax=Mikania micrantha TaxID=192012 RepID=A0A5N6MUY4_9ASTR|nr:hypothetical protein E3N88_26830 [Mikania micrantha]